MSRHSSGSNDEINSSDFDLMKSPGQKIETKKHRNSFLNKLEEMLSNPDNNGLIFWNDNGSSFIIKTPIEFSETILPKYYKHNKINSFVRQLNMYGFHKKSRASRGAKNSNHQSWEFYHPKFLKDKFYLRKDIHRLSSEKNELTFENKELSSFTPDDSIQQYSIYQTQQDEILSQMKILETNLAQVKLELSETNRILVSQKKVIQNLSASLINQRFPQAANSSLLSSYNIPNHVNNTPVNYSQPAIFITPPCDVVQNSSKQALQNYNNYHYGNMNHPINYMMNHPQLHIFDENHMNSYRPQMTDPVNARPILSINNMSLQSQPQPQTYLNSNQQCSEASCSDNDHYIVSSASPVSPMLFDSFYYPNS